MRLIEMDNSTANGNEMESDDELEIIGEIIRRDIPQRGSRPPQDELRDYDSVNGRDGTIGSDTPSTGHQSTIPLSEENSTFEGILPLLRKQGLIILVVLVFFVASSFLYFEFFKLENANQGLTQRLGDLEERASELEDINRNLNEMVTVSTSEAAQKSFDGTIALDNKSYNIGDVATVVVRDTDINTNPEKEDTVDVSLVNSNTNDQIPITLTETGINTGEFTQKFMLARETGETKIKVDTNDSIELIYTDEKSAKGLREVRKATADIV